MARMLCCTGLAPMDARTIFSLTRTADHPRPRRGQGRASAQGRVAASGAVRLARASRDRNQNGPGPGFNFNCERCRATGSSCRQKRRRMARTRRGRGQPRRRARGCSDRLCAMRPHARTARLPPLPRAAEVPLACGPPKPRPPAQLPSPPGAWLGAQAGLSSERPARPSPASVRAASGAALVIYTAPLAISVPVPHRQLLRQRQQASIETPAGRQHVHSTAAAGAQVPRTLPTCTLPPPLPSPQREQQLVPVSAAAAAAAAHARDRRAGAGLEWTDGARIVPGLPDTGRQVATQYRSAYGRTYS
jgi:hypothetical protein